MVPKLKNKVLNDVGLLKLFGLLPIVVHGGGPEITKAIMIESFIK